MIVGAVRHDGRIVGCCSMHTGACRPFDANKTGLWRCPWCHRLYCLEEGGSDSPLCDTCWGDPTARRRHRHDIPAGRPPGVA